MLDRESGWEKRRVLRLNGLFVVLLFLILWVIVEGGWCGCVTITFFQEGEDMDRGSRLSAAWIGVSEQRCMGVRCWWVVVGSMGSSCDRDCCMWASGVVTGLGYERDGGVHCGCGGGGVWGNPSYFDSWRWRRKLAGGV